MEHDEGNSKTVTSRHGRAKGEAKSEAKSAEHATNNAGNGASATPESPDTAAATPPSASATHETPPQDAPSAPPSDDAVAASAGEVTTMTSGITDTSPTDQPKPTSATPSSESSPGQDEGQGTTPAAPSEQEHHADGQFAPGEVLGPYIITHVLAGASQGASASPFIAVLSERQDAQGLPGLPGIQYLLVPLGAEEVERARTLAALGLQHARLLVPVAVVSARGTEYLVVEILAEVDGAAPQSVAAGAHLGSEEALRAGSGLADALAYLHRSGYTHGHIGPETIFVRDGRAYLGGIERASALDATSDQATEAQRADVNALARALADLAGVTATSATEEAPEQQTGSVAHLARIAATGSDNGYGAAEELAAACGQALAPTLERGESPEEAGPQPPQERFLLRVATATTVGMVRSENQDAVGTMFFEVHDDLIGDMPAGVFLVADGMGGEAHGEVASRIAARIVTSEMARTFFAPLVAIPATVAVEEGAEPLRPDEDLAAALVRAVTAANAQVRALSEYLNQATGTTLTALAVRGTQAVIAHLGDSRAYLLRDGELGQLTEDHSLLARMEALDHPLLHDDSLFISRSILYRSLGQEDAAPPDVLDVALKAGDRLMICSDGLWDELKDEVIAPIMAESADPQTCANELVRHANEAGGNDNSTALVIFVEPEPVDPAAAARSGQPE